MFFEKELKVGWVGRWIESGKSWKNIIKISLKLKFVLNNIYICIIYIYISSKKLQFDTFSKNPECPECHYTHQAGFKVTGTYLSLLPDFWTD